MQHIEIVLLHLSSHVLCAVDISYAVKVSPLPSCEGRVLSHTHKVAILHKIQNQTVTLLYKKSITRSCRGKTIVV